MSKKVWTILTVVIVVLLAWWLLSKAGDAAKEAVRDDTASAPAGAPQACGDDLACGNALLAACNPGSFVVKTEREEPQITVVGKGDVSCKITSSLALAALGPFAKPALDVNKDGKLEMACDVPLGLDFARLTTWLAGAGINGCEGELREFYDSLEI